VSAECPNDHTVIEADDLTWVFSFPADGDTVIAALQATLNQRPRPVCKRPVIHRAHDAGRRGLRVEKRFREFRDFEPTLQSRS
jgi:hypothetical protein